MLIRSNLLVDQIVIQQPDNGEPLLEGIVGKASPSMEVANGVSPRVRSMGHIIDVGHDIGFRRLNEGARSALTKGQEVIGSPVLATWNIRSYNW
jgi:hypothetical protein